MFKKDYIVLDGVHKTAIVLEVYVLVGLEGQDQIAPKTVVWDSFLIIKFNPVSRIAVMVTMKIH